MNPPQNPPPVGSPAWGWYNPSDRAWIAQGADFWHLEIGPGVTCASCVSDTGRTVCEVFVRTKKDLEAMKRQAEGIAHLMASKLEEWA